MNHDKEIRAQMDQTIDHDDARTQSLQESHGSTQNTQSPEESYGSKKKGDVTDDSELLKIHTGNELKLKQKITKSVVSTYQNADCNGKQNDNQDGKQSPEGKDPQCSTSQAILLSEKKKASNFPALHINIGSWKWTSSLQEGFMAKLYYSKRKLVWEFLKNALKYKMEIQWSDISAIRATFGGPGQQCSLEIELNQPPVFSRETNPQPRKHTKWTPSIDFTGGQASKFRRHHAFFPVGVLDKPYKKLMQFDKRLFHLSQKPFPSQASPHFSPPMFRPPQFAPNCNGLGPTPNLEKNSSQVAPSFNGLGHAPNLGKFPLHVPPNFDGVGPAPNLVNLLTQQYPITSRGLPNSFTLTNSSEPGSSLSNKEGRNLQITTHDPVWVNQPNFHIQCQANNNAIQSHAITKDNMFTSPNYPSNGIVLNDIDENLRVDSQSLCHAERSLLPEMNFAHNITQNCLSNGGLLNEFNYSLMEESQIKCYEYYLPGVDSSLSLDDSNAKVNNYSTNNSVMEYGLRDANLEMQNAVNNVVSFPGRVQSEPLSARELNQSTVMDPIVNNPNHPSELPWNASNGDRVYSALDPNQFLLRNERISRDKCNHTQSLDFLR